MKNIKGITLIALVITIIVLLILAGVSIATLTGENGILTKAGEAKEKSQRASAIEQAKIDILAWQTEKLSKNEDATLSDDIIKNQILNGKNYVKDKEAGPSSFITAEGEYEILYSELYKTSVAFNPETLEIGEAINSEKYGWKVTGYTKTTDEFTTGVWRLFYQDNNYTYLITDGCVGDYAPSDYYETITKEDGELKYQTGADVSKVGQRLNKMLLDEGTFLVEENTNMNLCSTAWFTDTEAEIWKKYKNEDALFAIGGPTIELYKASFNAAANANNADIITIEVGASGYSVDVIEGQLKPEYNYGIYNKGTSTNYWLISPGNGRYIQSGLCVNGDDGLIGYYDVQNSYSVRPIVCIPTSIFDSNYASTLVEG